MESKPIKYTKKIFREHASWDAEMFIEKYDDWENILNFMINEYDNMFVIFDTLQEMEKEIMIRQGRWLVDVKYYREYKNLKEPILRQDYINLKNIYRLSYNSVLNYKEYPKDSKNWYEVNGNILIYHKPISKTEFKEEDEKYK